MATKKDTKNGTGDPKSRNTLQVALRFIDDTPDNATSWALTRPTVQAAQTIQKWQRDSHDLNTLVSQLALQVDMVSKGSPRLFEEMLVAQSQTLDEIFNNLARRAYLNMGEFLPAAETYLRLALKAQSQCARTLEVLAAIKNPPIVFARQANIANGPQQVNNGVPTHAREIENQQSKLSGNGNELSSNTGTSALAGGVNQAVEAVGAIDGAEVNSG